VSAAASVRQATMETTFNVEFGAADSVKRRLKVSVNCDRRREVVSMPCFIAIANDDAF